MAGKPWTQEEKDFVKANYVSMSCAEMAEQLPGRTTRSVQHLFGQLGLERPQPKIGDKLGRYEILELFYSNTTPKKMMAKCQCECGQVKVVRATDLAQGRIVSCGCWKAEKAGERTTIRNQTHSMSSSPLYRQWAAMKTRCTNQNQKSWDDYGGRGITLCDEWQQFEPFRDWAMANGYQEGLEIDRRENSGNYEPGNCRWVTKIVQQNNRRSNHLIEAFGETKTIAEWVRDPRCVVCYQTLLDRINKLNWPSMEEALTIPPRPFKN